VKWKLSKTAGRIRVEATHPQTLDHQTWRLALSQFAKPKVVQGFAQVVEDNDAWMIIAGEGKYLCFEAETLTK
jgi:hypothetical protein